LISLLRELYARDIQLSSHDNKIRYKCPKNTLNPELINLIKHHKSPTLHRIKQNEAAKKQGFLIIDHGQLYEYRYSYNGYLYIERNLDGTTTAWRENHIYDDYLIISNHKPFWVSFKESCEFLSWLKDQDKNVLD
jgi:hypothetical protein